MHVYRYTTVKGEKYMELYFDNVFIASGGADRKWATAQEMAYKEAVNNVLFQVPPETIAASFRKWYDEMAQDRDICHIDVKFDGDDSDSLLTTNLANMKQMMQSNPDFSVPKEKLIVIEHETESKIDNWFICLELSATRNCMLLEVELVKKREKTTNFTCNMSLNGEFLGSKTHSTKNKAKRVCSEDIMKDLIQNNDHIFVEKEK